MLKETLFRILVKKYKTNVYGFCRYLLKNETDAEDAAQEVMIKLWNNLRTINPAAYKSWIMKTTYNLCIDYRRKNRIYDLADFSDSDDILYHGNETPADPVEIKENAELGELIDESVKRLPELYRSVFVLYQIEGLKYREISDILEMPINTVKVTLLRARKKLQILLKDVYEGRQAI